MQDGLQPLEKHQNKLPLVRVYAGHWSAEEYDTIGDGYLEIATDIIVPQPQHYIEVTQQNGKQLILRSRMQKGNGYQRKKKLIISWKDPEQGQEADLAISFQTIEECDMYWKIFCSKIGKNYLEINNECLEQPNQNNLNYLLEKAKKSYNLVAYNMINSPEFMANFWKFYLTFRQRRDEKAIQTIADFFKVILSHWDPKIMLILCKPENFQNFLIVFETIYIDHSSNDQLRPLESWKNLGKFNQLVPMSKTLSENIEIGLRGKFLKDLLNNEIMLENEKILKMVDGVIKQTNLSVLNMILSEKIIHQVIELYEKTSQQVDQSTKEKVYRDITMFFRQIYLLIWQLQSFKIKTLVFQLMRQQKVLEMLAKMLDFGFYQIIDVLILMARQDSYQFYKSFKQNFRKNPSISLNRTITKILTEGSEQSVRLDIMCFLKFLLPEVGSSRENFDFFNGTFIVSIFKMCNSHYRVLSFTNLILLKLEDYYYHHICSHIMKMNILTKTLAPYLDDNTILKFPSKYLMLELVKLIKIIVIHNDPKFIREQGKSELQNLRTLTNKIETPQEIQVKNNMIKYIIESKSLYLCFKYLQKHWLINNLLTSAILELVYAISVVPYSQLTDYLKQSYKFDLTNKENCQTLQKYLIQIQEKKKPDNYDSERELGKQAENYQQRAHRCILEDQLEQRYLQGDDKDERNQMNIEADNENGDMMADLEKMAKQIRDTAKQGAEMVQKPVDLKPISSQQPSFQIIFDLPPLDDSEPQNNIKENNELQQNN